LLAPIWGMALRRSLGVELRDLGQDELEMLEPDLKGRFRSAFWRRTMAQHSIRLHCHHPASFRLDLTFAAH
jgi:hypothetical protein